MTFDDYSRALRTAEGSRIAPEEFDIYQQVQMLWSLLDRSYVGVFWKDREGRFLGGNDWFAELFGVDSAADLIGKTDYDFFEKEVAESYRVHDFAVMESGEPRYDIDETLERVEGKTEVLRTSKMPVRNADGIVVAMMGCLQVVTTVVETEKALESLEGRFAIALETSRDAMWEYDIASRTFEVTPRLWELLDIDPPGTPPFTEFDMSALFATDFVQFDKAVNQVLAGEVDEFRIRHRLAVQDGSSRWLNIHAFPFRSDGKEITHVVGSVADETAKIEQERQLVYRASHDELTGLANRRALHEHLNAALDARTQLSVIFLDLDEFKVINDSLGHHVGDQLLEALAKRLCNLTRDGQMLSRLGGDEFAIVSPDCPEEVAVGMGQRILDALAKPICLNGSEMYLTCSVGVVCSSGQYSSADEILRDGDIALYSAKENGKSCVKQFKPWMGKEADALLDLQNRVRRAASQEEFLLHYQPIVSAADGSIRAVEALMRWQPEDSELLYPDSFLDYLESTGLIKKVGEWVVRESLSQLARWRKEYPAANGLKMSLNTSRAQFRSSTLVSTIEEALAENGLSPADLIVEVTETAITDDFELLATTLNELRDLGVQIAIDDFGVGQSSLSAIYDTPADIIKIDRAFISRIEEGRSEPMVDAMVGIARSAGMQITAEGVETQAQRDYLARAECDSLQGYFFGRPVSPSTIGQTFLQS